MNLCGPGKICEICKQSGEEGGNKNAHTIYRVPTTHVSNHTAQSNSQKERTFCTIKHLASNTVQPACFPACVCEYVPVGLSFALSEPNFDPYTLLCNPCPCLLHTSPPLYVSLKFLYTIEHSPSLPRRGRFYGSALPYATMCLDCICHFLSIQPACLPAYVTIFPQVKPTPSKQPSCTPPTS